MIRTVVLFLFVLGVIGVHHLFLRFKTVMLRVFHHLQISNFEMWGFTNKHWLLPILMASFHICVLFSGTLVNCYYSSAIRCVFALPIHCRQQPFFSTLLRECNYCFDVFIDLRNLFAVRSVSRPHVVGASP